MASNHLPMGCSAAPETEHPWVTTDSEPFTEQLKQLLLERCTKPLRLSFPSGSDEGKAIAKAINLGIDAHLEAVFCTHEWNVEEIGPDKLAKLEITVQPSSVPVLVRRLMEPWNHNITDKSEQEEWTSLASDICYVYQVELM